MSAIHIYTAPTRPVTRFTDASGGQPITITMSTRHLLYTDCCHRKRWAKYVEVQAFYDCIRRWCVDGRGCKIRGRDK